MIGSLLFWLHPLLPPQVVLVVKVGVLPGLCLGLQRLLLRQPFWSFPGAFRDADELAVALGLQVAELHPGEEDENGEGDDGLVPAGVSVRSSLFDICSDSKSLLTALSRIY